MACELQNVKVTKLDRKEKIAFFVNIYQVAYAHKLIKEKLSSQTGAKGGGMFSMIKNTIPFTAKAEAAFFYNIGDMNFTLDDIKHGILRGNKKSPNSYLFKSFGEKDLRNQIVQISDPRIVLLFQDDGSLPKKLEGYTGKDVDEKLDKLCNEFLATYVIFNPNEGEILLPAVFKNYKEDFGSTPADIITFVLKYYKFSQNADDVLKMVKKGEYTVSYNTEE